jgi:hypothetical protein
VLVDILSQVKSLLDFLEDGLAEYLPPFTLKQTTSKEINGSTGQQYGAQILVVRLDGFHRLDNGAGAVFAIRQGYQAKEMLHVRIRWILKSRKDSSATWQVLGFLSQ